MIDDDALLGMIADERSPAHGSKRSDGIAARDAGDLGMARRLVAARGARFRWAPQFGHWLVYEAGRWTEDHRGEIIRAAKSVVDDLLVEAVASSDHAEAKWLTARWQRSSAAPRIAAMIELARTEPGVPVLVDELDADPMLLNCTNGVLDLRAGELLAHDPTLLLSKQVGVGYDCDAAAPRWEQFLAEVFAGDREVIDFMRRWIGYCLTGTTAEQALVFMHGAGANGKSVMLTTLRRLLGPYSVQLDPRVLTTAQHEQHPTALTDLRGARVAVTVEVEQGARLAEVLVKSLTGSDDITARRMRGDYFTFTVSHKLVIAGNHRPRIRGTDAAIWRRILLVPFEQSFVGERCDPHLTEALEAELPGILAWAVAGCLDWQRDGLLVPERVRAASDAYRASEDHVGRWLADATCAVPDGHIEASVLRASYEAWCNREGERAWSMKALGAELTQRGFARRKANTIRWHGLALNTNTTP